MKQLFSLTFLILTLNFSAQIKHEFGPENKPAKDLRFNEVLGGSESYFYVHKINTKGKGINHFIQKMDRKTLLTVDVKEIILEENDYTIDVSRIICYDDELTAFVTKRYRKTKDFKLVAIIYDVNTMTKIKETQLEAFDSEPYSLVKLGLDNSKTLIKVRGNFIVYDLVKGMVIWNGKGQEKFKNGPPLYTNSSDAYLAPAEFVLDIEGNIHFAYTVLNKGASTDKLSLFDFYYSNINTKMNECKDYQIKSEYSCNIWDPTITCLVDKKVILSAMFKETNPDKKTGLRSGVVNCVIDNNKSTILSKKFSEITEFNPSGDIDDSQKNIKYAYEIDESFPYGNTSVLIGHKRRDYEAGLSTQYAMISYADIFVLKVNQNSEIEFYKELPYRATISGWAEDYIVKQFISGIDGSNLFVFHNTRVLKTKNDDNSTKESEADQVPEGIQFLCNKINLIDGTNKKTIIEIPEKNKFNPTPESNCVLSSRARPLGSLIYNQWNKTLYIPILWGYSIERFLRVTLE